ncbi:Hsp20/alpha crystallin family protein [Rhizobium vallis]|uniref:Hsp20/alpha crystallin family protein n=1 Tax=Rhizobium vallis TaxID=634290 RepID=A0A432PHN8_9HYPH|nr:Hsp20/alpha crystallin family protein [Rhizobium vallis]RUM23882.1 Hsp20/alpha crystallin family protein [Rhizobium vallis]
MNQIILNGPSASSEPSNAGPIFTPPADILEKGETVVMLVDIPGADPASLDITLDNHILTIMARVTSAEPEGYTPVYHEFRDGTYERRFVFSEQMDGEHIDAVLKDGVLRLTVPKAANTAKKINVKAE